MATFLFILAILALLEGLYSFRMGLQFRSYLRRQQTAPVPRHTPPTTLILPCRGLDPGFKENALAFLEQDYPDFQLLLVTDSASDPCVPVLRESMESLPEVRSRMLIAGQAVNCGQKVHNLLNALDHLRPQDQVVAFADSDIRPSKTWLRRLVGPLEDPDVGVSTGFRWYLPQSLHAASLVRTAWNAGAVSILKEKQSPFAWGGAMALRLSTFRECRVREAWQGALSDDYALSHAVKKRGKSIRFQPHCLSPSLEDCGWKDLWSWSFRQLAITRVYDPKLWGLALGSQPVHLIGLWGGLAYLIAWPPANWSLVHSIWAFVLALIYGLACWKAALRSEAVSPYLRPRRIRFRALLTLFGPMASWITLAGLIRTLWSREIEWRGIRYRMVSARKTELLGRQDPR